jgi:hypothetical protein
MFYLNVCSGRPAVAFLLLPFLPIFPVIFLLGDEALEQEQVRAEVHASDQPASFSAAFISSRLAIAFRSKGSQVAKLRVKRKFSD